MSWSSASEHRVPSGLLTPLTPPVSIFALSATCQTSKGRMEGGCNRGRGWEKEKERAVNPVARSLERADVKTAARTSRPSNVIRSKSAAQSLVLCNRQGDGEETRANDSEREVRCERHGRWEKVNWQATLLVLFEVRKGVLGGLPDLTYFALTLQSLQI
ncbi:hypothetical protein B0H13DRAFT_2265805 [Mycena leptocephala]|nr:hypothetical protein B0H13DRAFT_2265805 [Mycena leptocephala]